MDSPEPSKINVTASTSNLNAISTTPSSESPQVQESPFFRFVSNLSPIKPVKASHVAQSFIGLNSPPLVFQSPRISCHRETKFLERPLGTQSPSDNVGNNLGEVPGDSKKLNSQQLPPETFITDTQKDIDIKNDMNTQNCSPPPSVDEYLADPGDMDRMYSVNPDVEQSNDAVDPSLGDLTQPKENISKIDRKDGPSDEAEIPLPLSDESNNVCKEKPAYVEEPEKIEEEKKDVESTSQEHIKFESNLAEDDFEKENNHDPLLKGCNGCSPWLMPDPLQDVKECGKCSEVVSTSHVSAENITQDGSDSEACVRNHGIRRRCLQFEEAASNSLGSNKFNVKSDVTSSKMKMVKMPEPITSMFPQRGSTNLPVTVSKPSGIGLHLNSIINAMPPGRAATTGIRLSDGLQGMKSSSSISLHKVETTKRSVISSNSVGQSLIDTRNESHDASIAVDSFVSKSPSLTDPIFLNPVNTHDKRKASPTNAGNSEESNQPSPSKKKKKTSTSANDNGCKRCNCKKSKCLKLYCDCFAAGIYCSDHCTCQGCFNRPEHEGTVLETRQQIESRNPLAFAPKIVQHTPDIASNNTEDANLTTPSSARHKRGCNCKRSMCLKKYCECFQANVGCSSGCRCEGCKNAFGKKEDYTAYGQALSKERVSSSVEKGSELLPKELYDLHHFSPLTPSVECSDQGKEAAKSRLLSGKSENSHNSLELLETNEMLGTASYDSQIDCNNVNIFDQPSNEWVKIPPSRFSQGYIRQISAGSLRWRSSPTTPRTNVGEEQYLQCPESDSKLFDILEDETPDILMDASTPIKSVKANSPNQKRVSPPQSYPRGIGSNSSGGLRSGRKFILKAVPSFPPLSPCVDSKVNAIEYSGNDASK